MKVGIVTVHNSHNCGSYLQAIALCEYVRSIGYDARFLKNKIHPQSSPLYKSLLASKYFLKGKFKKALGIFIGSMKFLKARNGFSYFSSYKNVSACIYGSDTIWNINSKHLNKQWEHYFGKNYKGFKIAYAPSIGESEIESIINIPEFCDCIKEFSAVSVRDENTYKMVSSVIGENADIKHVVDPTMLMPKSFYEGIANSCKEENFILFYYFGTPDKAYMEQIKKYAKKNGKKLISFGENIKDADKEICFNPLDMLGYYAKADLIITNTFHGNVFSLIFNKPFVNIDAGKAKVNDLLENFDLSERTAKAASDFLEITEKNIDFNKVNSLLEEKKTASQGYLKNALEECKRRIWDAR